MAWQLGDEEFEAVSALDPERRYEYFVARIVDTEQSWSLAGEGGWVLGGDSRGAALVPVWPHERYAAACAIDEWEADRPKAIPLEEWLERWTAGMARDDRLAAVFPTPKQTGFIVEPRELRRALEDGLKQY
jgi:hypothetical protein